MSSSDTDDITADSGEPSSVASNADGGVALALEPRVLARHEELGDALRRLEDGSYGVCASCGTSIPFGRLLVMPETTRCMSCGPRA